MIQASRLEDKAGYISAVTRFVYFFSGEHRQSGLASSLREHWPDAAGELIIEEVDLSISADHDLAGEELRTFYRKRLRAGFYHGVGCTPPCNSFSRIVWKNSFGPKPCRSRMWPRGFPWASQQGRARAETGNIFVDFLVDIMTDIRSSGLGDMVMLFGEHPEDLGFKGTIQPASIWQWDSMAKAAGSCFRRGALYECAFCTPDELKIRDFPKPTGIITNSKRVLALTFAGWPEIATSGSYLGPLPSSCGHVHRSSLLRKATDTGFKTGATAAYPPAMDNAIGLALVEDMLAVRQLAPSDGERLTRQVQFPPAPPIAPASSKWDLGRPSAIPAAGRVKLLEALRGLAITPSARTAVSGHSISIGLTQSRAGAYISLPAGSKPVLAAVKEIVMA
jgi:hypothetical protein